MKKKRKGKIKLIILIIFIIIFVLLGILFYLEKDNKEYSNVTSNDNSNVVKSINDFKSVREIIEFSSSKFISEEESDVKGYNFKYKVEFKYNLYENNESQEKFFVAIINRISYLHKYNKNYILTDEKNNIEIMVKCNGKETSQILINGDKNYYLKNDNEISKKDSKLNSYSNFIINSDEIKNTINNQWSYEESNYGTKDSEFNDYDLFWDEGISVKLIQNKVYNIVFNSDYQKDVVGGITVSDDFGDIISKLGEPTFGSIDSNSIGYKTEDIYIFFSENFYLDKKISIYPNIKSNNEEFEALLEKFINSEIDLKDFMNKLTYLWPDYASYEYSNNYLKICYPDKGVKIEYGNDTSNGINIYENYQLSDFTNKLLKEGKLLGNLNKSLFYEMENSRISKEDSIVNSASYLFEFDNGKDEIESSSDKYSYSYEQNENGDKIKVYFISKDKSYPNKELKENVYKCFFIDNNYFVYSIKNKGIYLYNLITNEKLTLIEGESNYELKKYEDDILYYDDENISLELE